MKRGGNLAEEFVWVVQNELVRESEDFEAERAERGVTRPILLLDFRGFVNVPIEFDVELVFRAEEVGDVVSNLVLPPELQCLETSIAQELPRDVFGGRLLLPEFSNTFDQPRIVKTATILRRLSPFTL